jgi:hypothetical protein
MSVGWDAAAATPPAGCPVGTAPGAAAARKRAIGLIPIQDFIFGVPLVGLGYAASESPTRTAASMLVLT